MAEQKAAQLVFLVVAVEVRSESRHMGPNWLWKLAGPLGTESCAGCRAWMGLREYRGR